MKNNDEKGILYERALITCLIMLVVAIIIKLFGFPWFDINTEIPILKLMNNLISNNLILWIICTLCFKTINMFLVLSIITKDFKITFKSIHIIIIVCFISMFIVEYLPSYISMTFDTLSFIVLGSLYFKGSLKECILCFILNIVYQIITLFVRSLSFNPQNYGFLNYIVLNLDYYILLITTYLYLKKGDKTICGVAMDRFGFSLKNRLWKKHSKNYSIDNE